MVVARRKAGYLDRQGQRAPKLEDIQQEPRLLFLHGHLSNLHLHQAARSVTTIPGHTERQERQLILHSRFNMILTAPHLIRALRWIPPGVTILGTSCTFLNFWAAMRALTLPLPGWVYSRLEEMLYSNYQAMVGFWYETWSGVEVRRFKFKEFIWLTNMNDALGELCL